MFVLGHVERYSYKEWRFLFFSTETRTEIVLTLQCQSQGKHRTTMRHLWIKACSSLMVLRYTFFLYVELIHTLKWKWSKPLLLSQDLRNLRTQLYSAAEYFELSYTTDDKRQMWVLYSAPLHIQFHDWNCSSFYFSCFKCRVVETLKDYAVKALVNTVDHLGSITYKVNDFIDEKVDEVAETELRVSCIEQVKI